MPSEGGREGGIERQREGREALLFMQPADLLNASASEIVINRNGY